MPHENRSLQELGGLLEQQLRIYELLAEASREKGPAIVRNQTKELEGIVAKEKAWLSELKTLEQARIECTSAAAKQLGLSGDEPTLSALAAKAGKADAARLTQLGKRMAQAVNEIRDNNLANGKLLQTSLDYIDFMMNFAAGTEDISNIYVKDGDRKDNQATTLGLFDKQI